MVTAGRRGWGILTPMTDNDGVVARINTMDSSGRSGQDGSWAGLDGTGTTDESAGG
jgi:hypothetical protein